MRILKLCSLCVGLLVCTWMVCLSRLAVSLAPYSRVQPIQLTGPFSYYRYWLQGLYLSVHQAPGEVIGNTHVLCLCLMSTKKEILPVCGLLAVAFALELNILVVYCA